MAEHIDYWRGFTGGFVAGVAIGAFLYFSPSFGEDKAAPRDDRNQPDLLSLHRESAESAGDPARLVPATKGVSKIDFERSGQSAG